MKNLNGVFLLTIILTGATRAFGASSDPLVPAGKKALILLSNSLSDSDERIRAQAARAWGKIGNPAAIPVLKQALRDKDDSVRIEAASSLFKLGSSAGVPILESIIRQGAGDGADLSPIEELHRIAHDKMRVLAIRKLFTIQGKKVEALLKGLLDDSSGEVRDAAAAGLARLGLPDFESEFISALDSPDAAVRIAAVKDLGDIGTPEALDGLKKAASDPSVEVREEAMRALAAFPQKASAEILDQGLKDQDARVRAQALSSLALLSDSGSTSLLQGILDASSNSDTRLEAEAGLAHRGQSIDLDLAERILGEKDQDLKNLALNVLRAEDSARSNEILAHVMFGDLDIRLRLRAATFLLEHISAENRKGP